MLSVVVSAVKRGCFAFALVLIFAPAAIAATNEPATIPPPGVLTNLSQLRDWAQNDLTHVHPFHIVAEVYDVDPVAGVLVLHDATGLDFIHTDFKNQDIKPGSIVDFAGEGCALRLQGFGLEVVPRLVLDVDGVRGFKVASSTAFLHAGLNPITAQWFNHLGHASLRVEYVGPGVPRQALPPALLSRASVDPVTHATNFVPGLDYQCFEDVYEHLPNFAISPPTKTGVAANFDVNLRTRPENAAMEFNGFLSVRRDGVYTFIVSSDDGIRLFVGQPSIRIKVLSDHPAPAEIRGVPTETDEQKPNLWVTLEGTVNFSGIRGAGGEMQIRVGNDDIRVDVFESGKSAPNLPLRSKVRVSGIYRDVITDEGTRIPGVLRVSSWNYVHVLSPAEIHPIDVAGIGERASLAADKPLETTATRVISTVAEIKALAPELANKRLPVAIRGVITATVNGGAVIQDATRGIYVFLPRNVPPWPLQRGEICRIDGVTSSGLFAPSILAQRITHLGNGQLPQPLQATSDQLVNGTLDTEYAELEGVIAKTYDQRIELLANGGKVLIYLDDFRPDVLAGYQNSLVRIRGCVFARFNEATHKLEPGSLRMSGAAVQVLETSPSDVFATPKKSIAELLLYDPKATPFRRLKISGQVIYGSRNSYYLTDGTNGIHVTMRSGDGFVVGDLVDAVGFLELGGPGSELKEAVMRKTGVAPLPPPTTLTAADLLMASRGGTLVRVDATLMNQWIEGSEHVLELQSGFLAFRGRIDGRDQAIPLPPSGSRLQLTGVYAVQGNRQSDGKVNSFELLLHSPLNIRVLATPPWWNLKRVLILAGILSVLLCGVLVWNKELQRKVQERTRQLEAEIRHRQKVEVQRAAEAERARIARDLHDELGSGLTEVTLLASTGFGDFRSQKSGEDRFGTIAEKARALVSRLDVIVWAIDPTRNSLQSFADYVSSYAKEFLAASNVLCRLKIPIECKAVTLAGTARHNLFLAVKESLNNVIRHAGATEVELQLAQFDHYLEIAIVDNGRGFDRTRVARGHGLANLEQRLTALNGECRIESQPGKGTTIKLVFPLLPDPE